MDTYYATPIRELVEESALPLDFVGSDDGQVGALLDRIFFTDYSITSGPNGIGASISLVIAGEAALAIPGVEGLAFVFGSDGAPATNVKLSFFLTSSGMTGRLDDVSIAIRFPRDVLSPMPSAAGVTPARFSQIEMRGTVTMDEQFNIRVAGFSGMSLKPAMVGESGIVISADNVQVDLTRTDTTPEIAAGGFDESFMGVFIGEAQVRLPEGLPSLAPEDLILKNAAIGRGGVSGSLTAQYTVVYDPAAKSFSGPGAGEFFGVAFGVGGVAIALRQNALVESTLTGQMLLPFFETPVAVGIGINLDGSLTVNLTDPAADGLLRVSEPGVFEMAIESLGVEVTDGVMTAKVSGDLKPLFAGIDWPTFKVNELSIDSEGSVNLEGGWLDLRDAYSLTFYGFRMEVTKLGFGRSEDGGKWIGFSGGLKLVDGLSAGASVQGLRLTWYDDDRSPDLSLDGVGVECEVPDVLRFKGQVALRHLPDDVHRFDGDITLDLMALDMQLDAQLVIGSAGEEPEDYNFLAIYLGTELPAGIPIGATGLALYGVAGLFALEMEPNRLPDEAWFEKADGTPGWYRRPTEGVSDLSTKWGPSRGSLALGAGATLGTLTDNGHAFSGKLLLGLVFPGPILFLEGRANMLKERTKLDEAALFRALAVLDVREGTFLMNLAAAYKHGSGGELIDIHAGAEAFFDFSDAYAWHVYLGQKEPREARVRAELFRLFESNSYFMLDARQVAMGAWVGYDRSWRFGPLSVTVEAWLEGNAVLSWKPVYLHGDLWLHGSAGVSAFGFGASVGVDAQFRADVFDPLLLHASFTVGIGMPWPISDISKTIELEWGPEGDAPPLPMPLKEIAVEHLKSTVSWPLPRPSLLLPPYDSAGDGFIAAGFETTAALEAAAATAAAAEPPDDAPVVPLDARPHVTFGRAVHDVPLIGTNASLVEPPGERIGDPALNEGPLEVGYTLRGIELHKFDGGWTLVARRREGETDVGDLYGSWAAVPAPVTGVAQVKLWLWSKNAFDYTRHSGSAWDEWFTDESTDYPCVTPPPDRVICCSPGAVAAGTQLRSPYNCPGNEKFTIGWVYPPTLPVSAIDPPVAGFARGLCVPAFAVTPDGSLSPNRVAIGFPEPARSVRLVIAEPGGPGGVPVTATAFTPTGHPIGPVTPAGHIIAIEGDPGVDGGSIARVVVQGGVCILQVCLNLGPDPEQLADYEEMVQHLIDEMARWSQEGEVLEPNTQYRLTIVTGVSATAVELTGVEARELELTEFAYFRTQGPPGLAALSVPSNQSLETFDSGLDDLVRYVRQTIPASVPATGDKPVLARPVYRAFDIGVSFNEDYVELMYRRGGRDLGLYLYDNSNRPVRDIEGRLVNLSNRWGQAEELTLTTSDLYWITAVNEGSCASIDITVIPHHSTLTSAAEAQVLEPDTIYEARLVPLLLHETFATDEVGDTATGTGSRLGRWVVVDEGLNSGPSVWEVREVGSPASRYVIQTSNIWGGTTAANDPVKPGTLLVYVDTPSLEATDPGQPSQWGDYRLSAYLRAEDDDALGVVFRYADPSHHYRFLMDRERTYRRLLRVYDGVTTVLGEDDIPYRLNRHYSITVEALGPSLRVYVDGDLVFDVTDETMANGTVGLCCWGNTGARFSDIRVDAFGPAAPVVYRFAFTTSLFTNFFHHMHSYQDETWRVVLAAAAPIDEPLALAAPIGVPPSETEARAYEEIASLAGLATVPDPDEVQVVRVEAERPETSTVEPVGLLVQCAEPIDWTRTDLQVLRATRLREPTVAPGSVKLTDTVLGGFSANEEQLTLLVRSATDLSRHRIEYQTFPTPLIRSGHDTILLDDDFGGPEAGLLFEEAFGPNALDRYTVVDEGGNLGPSNWLVLDGAIVQTTQIYGGDTQASSPPKPGTMLLLRGSDAWPDTRMRVRFSSGDNDAIGLVFRFADIDNYYRISFDRERTYRRLVKKVQGVFTVLWEETGEYAVGQPYELVVEAVADRIVVLLDGFVLCTVRDADLGSGAVGFYCWANSPSRFERLVVESLHSDPLLWQSTFPDLGDIEVVDAAGADFGPSTWVADAGVLSQTSGIAVSGPGVELLGTYALIADYRWRDIQFSVRMRSDDDGAIGVMFGYQDDDNYFRFSMASEGSYRRLVKRVAGSTTVLWQDSVPYTVGQSYDVTIGLVGREIRVQLQGALLCVVDDGDIAAGQVALYCWSNAAAHFERGAVLDASRQLGQWSVRDEAPVTTPSVWAAARGELLQRGAIGGETPDQTGTLVVRGDPGWSDYRVTSTMRSDHGGAIGLVFRYLDDDNYYRFTVDHQLNLRRLTKRALGLTTTLWESAEGYPIGEDFTLTVDAVSGRLVGYFEAERLFDITDGTHSFGQVGLSSWRNPGCRFQSLDVAEPPLESYALMVADFRNGDLSAWTVQDEGDQDTPSAWVAGNGSLRQTSNIFDLPNDRDTLPKRGTQVIGGDLSWGDVVVTARLRSSDDDALGICFRYQDADNHYRFSMDAQRGYRRLVKRVAGSASLLWETTDGFELGRAYEVTISAVAGELRGYLDGVPMFTVDDADLLQGRIALYCWGNTGAEFSQVRVYPAATAQDESLLVDAFDGPNLSHWTIVDSGDLQEPSDWQLADGWLRQTSGIRDDDLAGPPEALLGTQVVRGDPSWSDYRHSVRLASFTNDAIGVHVRYVDEDNYYRFSMDAQRGYRRLIKRVSGIVTVLWEDDVPYVIGHEHLISVDCNGSRLTGWSDGQLMFDVDDTEVSSGQIGLYCWGNTDARFADVRVDRAVWAEYHQFPRESRLAPGTRVKVHGGNPSDYAGPAVAAGEAHRFAASLDSGGSVRLAARGAAIRVVDPQGQVVHARTFLSETEYSDMNDARVIRKADGTAFVITGSGPPPIAVSRGEYRLRLAWRRDNRASDPDSQVLSQAGDVSTELVTIDVPWHTR